MVEFLATGSILNQAAVAGGDLDLMGVFIGAGGAIVAMLVLIWMIKTLIRICPPNKAYVFSGRDHITPSGKKVGYRIVQGGRAYKYPIIETIEEIDLSLYSVAIRVTNAYSKGGIALDVQSIANVKVSSDEVLIHNAIERFLGRNKSEILRVARETLEGNLRGVISTLTPEQINEDRMKFADRVSEDVKKEMDKLGLHLDVFKIQSVSDKGGYLKAMGRQRISMIVKEAEVAESNYLAEAKQVEANMTENSQIAQTQAKDTIRQKENELRQIQAALEAKIQTEEEVTIAAEKSAEATAMKELQELRAELEEIRLQVEEVLPAQANKKAAQLIAEGRSAMIAERGLAMAYAVDSMSDVWKYAGKDSMAIVLMEKIETILKRAASTVDQLDLNNITLIDGGSGDTINGIVKAHTDVISTIFSAIDDILGVNLATSLKQEV